MHAVKVPEHMRRIKSIGWTGDKIIESSPLCDQPHDALETFICTFRQPGTLCLLCKGVRSERGRKSISVRDAVPEAHVVEHVLTISVGLRPADPLMLEEWGGRNRVRDSLPQHPARSAYSLALEDGRLERLASVIEELVGANVSFDLCSVHRAAIVCKAKSKGRGRTVADHEKSQERESGGKAEGLGERGRLLRA